MTTKEFTEIPVAVKISNDDINSILEKSLNEGSLHWCYDYRSKYDQSTALSIISNGGSLLLYGMDGSVYELNRDKVLLGIQQSIPYITRVINGINLDIRSIDSDGADLIIQMALFNELKFD